MTANKLSDYNTQEPDYFLCLNLDIEFLDYQKLDYQKYDHFFPHSEPLFHFTFLSLQVKDTSSAFMSLVKMHSTRYDLSPRPCPPPCYPTQWCLLRSKPCWSSREQQGRRDNKTTWSPFTTFLNTLYCILQSSRGQHSSLWSPTPSRKNTDTQIGVDTTILSLIYWCKFYSWCGWAPGVFVDIFPLCQSFAMFCFISRLRCNVSQPHYNITSKLGSITWLIFT